MTLKGHSNNFLTQKTTETKQNDLFFNPRTKINVISLTAICESVSLFVAVRGNLMRSVLICVSSTNLRLTKNVGDGPQN